MNVGNQVDARSDKRPSHQCPDVRKMRRPNALEELTGPRAVTQKATANFVPLSRSTEISSFLTTQRISVVAAADKKRQCGKKTTGVG